MYPCPRDGPTFRPQAVAEGGKKQVCGCLGRASVK